MAIWSAAAAPLGEVEPVDTILAEAVASELAVDAHELSAEQLGARSVRLRREIDRLSVAVARTDAVFEATRAFRTLDPSCTKASQWLATQTRVPIKQARAAYRQARRLALLTTIQAAVIAGTMTLWHAASVAKLAASPARVRRLRLDAADLTEAAERSAPSSGSDCVLGPRSTSPPKSRARRRRPRKPAVCRSADPSRVSRGSRLGWRRWPEPR